MGNFEIITADAVVVGSGAAGYNAAIRLKQEGIKKVLLVTEGVNCGTSRNTGSDKQTYYKLGLGGETCLPAAVWTETMLCVKRHCQPDVFLTWLSLVYRFRSTVTANMWVIKQIMTPMPVPPRQGR